MKPVTLRHFTASGTSEISRRAIRTMLDPITQVGGGEMGTGVEIDLVSRDIVLIAEFTAIDQLIVTGQIMVI